TIAWQWDTVQSEGRTGFPTQQTDISYGISFARESLPLVPADADVDYLVPQSAEQLDANWTNPDFVDTESIWTTSPAGNGIGFDTGQVETGDPDPSQDYSGLIATDVTDAMHGQNGSTFVRSEFEVENPALIDQLLLRVRYDDGFVATINGTEVARRSAPDSPGWDATAAGRRADGDAVRPVEIPLLADRLTRDFNATADGTFVVDLPNGTYDVALSLGDLKKARDAMAIFLEETRVDTVNTEPGTFARETYRVDVSDGQLTVRLVDEGGATGRMAINGLQVVPVGPSDLTEPLRFDFGTETSPIENGYAHVSDVLLYAAEFGYGWSEGVVSSQNRDPAIGLVGLLQPGTNVLAIQGLNLAADNSDFLLQAELEGLRLTTEGSVPHFFSVPSPGSDANRGASQVAAPATFSRAGGTFSQDFLLELSTEVPGGTIHYTTDGSLPTALSPIYDPATPLAVTTTTQVRTLVIAPGYLNSPLISQTFLRLAPDLLDFSSPIPIVVLDSFETIIPQKNFRSSNWSIFEPIGADQRSALVNAPDLQTRAGLRRRGESSSGFPKQAFRVEAWDEQDRDEKIAPLGLPAAADWILNARSTFDQSMLSNAFMFELSNQTGRYAVRTRFVEVFVNQDDGVLERDDYVGVYALMERIEQGEDRVNVEKPSKNYDTEPLITGGYVLKIDSIEGPSGYQLVRGPDGVQVENRGKQRALFFVDPRPEDMESPEWVAQKDYILDYIFDGIDLLDNRDPVTGYASMIDVDSFVDHHLLNTMALGGDTLKISEFMFKSRTGRLELGPIWDFDRSMGANATQRNNGAAVGWGSKTRIGPWFDGLFQDPDFRQKYVDRYQQLREGVWSIENINTIFSSLTDQLTDEAAARNFEIPDLRAGLSEDGWRGEVEELRNWIEIRLNWLDDQMIPKPQITIVEEDGEGPGTRVTLALADSAPSSLEILYTLDGTDPRISSFAADSDVGGIAPPAVLDAGEAITVPNGSTLRVRAFEPVAGDMDFDGNIDFDDIQAFVLGLDAPADYEAIYGVPPEFGGDLNGDDQFDADDVNELVQLLTVASGNGNRIYRLESAAQTIFWSGDTTLAANVEPPTVAITEINYHPHDPTDAERTVDGTFSASDFEFVEIQNIGPDPQGLGGMEFADGITFTFPDVTLDTGQYAIVAANQTAFETRYGPEANVVGEFSGKLRNGDETLQLNDASGDPLIRFAYGDGDPWPARADGAGGTLELIDPTGTPITQYGKWYRWQGSTEFGGSPGRDGQQASGVVINEVVTRANADGTLPDAIELLNTTTNPIDVSGWYLSDSAIDFLKYRIPDGTTVAAGGYLVVDENDFNPTPDNPAANHFALSGTRGDDVWLVRADDEGAVVQLIDDVHFGASVIGESFGRTDAAGDRLVPLRTITLGEANSDPRVGPVVISEVQYHPSAPSEEALAIAGQLDGNDLEYLEIRNPTATPVDLGQWELSGGVRWTFPAQTQLGAGESLLVISFDPNEAENAERLSAFRAQYALDESVPIVGGYAGSLGNSDDLVTLLRVDSSGAAAGS
ncbi:MAG: CotH kinase family protein, partial [Pirellulales bacterium]